MSSSIDATTRLERGRRMFERTIGGSAQAFIDGIATVAPDFGPLILEWEFGDAYSRDTIDLKTREIVILAACAALGATGADAVKLHVGAALRAGVTREQIAEILMQVGFAAGLPAALCAIGAVKAAFAELDASDTSG
jgi:4-carboxymuconolactone decarboxylase